MSLKPITTLSLKAISNSDPLSAPQSFLLINSHNTGMIISGVVLRATLTNSANRYLLFTTDGVDYEDTLNITLLDPHQDVIEVISLGGPYITGMFADLSLEEDRASFSFFGDTTWTVKILDVPTFRLPFSDPRGVSRGFGLKKFIDISANPPPARSDGRR